jgi:hypothetical protein
MTDGFPLVDGAQICVAPHSQVSSDLTSPGVSEYADEYELTDIGLAMRLYGPTAA